MNTNEKLKKIAEINQELQELESEKLSLGLSTASDHIQSFHERQDVIQSIREREMKSRRVKEILESKGRRIRL